MLTSYTRACQERVISLLLNNEGDLELQFEKILKSNNNNIPLSIVIFRRWIRDNTNRGIVDCDKLSKAIEFNTDDMKGIISEMFLDDISQEMCNHIRDILVVKKVSVQAFHSNHLQNVDKPIQRLLSSL